VPDTLVTLGVYVTFADVCPSGTVTVMLAGQPIVRVSVFACGE
jgi:hypothetical protein